MSSLKGIELFQLLHWKCSMKKALFTNFAIFAEKQLCWSLFLIELPAFRPNTGVLKFSRKSILKNASELTLQEVIVWKFVSVSRSQNHPDIVILQKYQSLSKKSFKHNPAHMPFLYLTPTRSFKPMFVSYVHQ